MADDQLAQLSAYTASDSGMRSQYLYRPADLRKRRGSRAPRSASRDKVHDALEIVKRCR
jgi:hypothetical protein